MIPKAVNNKVWMPVCGSRIQCEGKVGVNGVSEAGVVPYLKAWEKTLALLMPCV